MSPPDAATVTARIRRDFLPVPPLTVHSASPELYAAVWSLFRETVLAEPSPRSWREAVAATVARTNRCPFCVEAHTMFLHGLVGPAGGSTARAIARGNHDEVRDPELRAIVDWAAAGRDPAAPELRRPPFGAESAPQLVGTTVLFHYLTRVVEILLGPSPIPRGFRWMRGTVHRAGGALLAGRLDAGLAPGGSLDLLPEAPLPEDLAWARPDPAVAGAFARFAAAIEAAGGRALAPSVRRLVAGRVERWRGEDPPLGDDWLTDAVAALDTETQRTEARLALLAAFAPYRVTGRELEAYGTPGTAEAGPLEAIAWSAFTAARRIGRWISDPEGAAGGDPGLSGTPAGSR